MGASIFIRGPLPSLNEMLAAARSRRGRGSGYSLMKAQWGETVWRLAKSARTPHVEGPVSVTFHWRERDRKRDIDNVAASCKFVLDGLVKAGVLDGDGWQHVTAISHLFCVDAQAPGVLVSVEPCPF